MFGFLFNHMPSLPPQLFLELLDVDDNPSLTLYVVVCRQIQVQQIMQSLQQQDAFTKLSAAEQQQVAFSLLLQPQPLPTAGMSTTAAATAAAAVAAAAAVQQAATPEICSTSGTVDTSR